MGSGKSPEVLILDYHSSGTPNDNENKSRDAACTHQVL